MFTKDGKVISSHHYNFKDISEGDTTELLKEDGEKPPEDSDVKDSIWNNLDDFDFSKE